MIIINENYFLLFKKSKSLLCKKTGLSRFGERLSLLGRP